MEVAESPVVGFLHPPSTAESMKPKKKNKSHKDQKSDEPLEAAHTNGTMSSPPPEDDESRPSKRKRDSESGHKKNNKKKRREAEDDAHGELDPHEQSHMFDQEENGEDTADVNMEVDNTPSKDTREPGHTASGVAPLHEGSQDPGTPSEARLKRTRGSRIGAKSHLKVGFFVEEEVKALEEFKIQFCNTHGIAGRTFDAMVQHSERGGEEWPVQTHICNKGEFWNDVYSLIPDRDRRSVYRFMRRHFQDTTQKAHDWTLEQDEELIKLHAQHGPKYALIAKLLGRSDDDVTQRWKNRLQHRATKKTGAWSEDELRAFMRSLEEYRNLLITSSAEPQKAGKDIWDMDLKSISWGSISNGMDNSRTRQQCADKWRKIQKNVAHVRQTLDPDAVFDPADAVKRYHRWNRGPAGEKSKTYVEDDDDDEADESDESRIPSTTPAIIPKLEFAAEQQMDLARVAKEGSVDSSPAQNRNGVDNEDSDDGEDEMPSSPLSDHSRSEVKKLRDEKKERRRRRKEKKERRRQEAAAVDESAEEVEDPSTPKEKRHKDKKHRKSEASGSDMHDVEPVESSKKKSKKDKKNKKAAQE
ncbi:DNA-binding protein REB1 [Penicillium subrubescens]|uniref:DNA-binding protein REB1 n=1 Tax=Penicillium subrubescens TaxID=1316194 RepID=A0A1Q5UQD4_9EURO|nr:DNA-binding protein REB1 [Penicillium subrubescens]